MSKADDIIDALDPDKRYCPKCKTYRDKEEFLSWVKPCYNCCDRDTKLMFGWDRELIKS